MMNIQRIAATAALILLATGCAKTTSSNINQGQIYTAYEATYRYGGPGYTTDSSTPILRLSATFNVAGPTGTYVQLDGQSQVTVNGSTMTENQDLINQVFYTHEKDAAVEADAQQSYAFTYTDNDGKQYQNTLSIPPTITVANAASTSYSLAAPLHISWSAPTPVATSETLTGYVEKTDGSYFVSSQSGTVSGNSGDIIVGSDSLGTATAGNAMIYVCRSRSGVPAQAPSVGGSISVTRCSPKIAVVFH